MWKVSNIENKEYLDAFRSKLIEPMFKEIINYKMLNLECSYFDYLKRNNQTICKDNNKLLLLISNRTLKKVKFKDLLQNFIDSNDVSKIKYYYTCYNMQNDEINNGNYNIFEIEIDDNLKKIFIDFFYEKFFNDKKVWKMIINSKKDVEYSKIEFNKIFINENKLYVCPYCDSETIIGVSNKEIEHFLPKSKYPLLSMNANNLISSCMTCNKPSEGKGTRIYTPITSPYNKSIGNEIEYKNDFMKKEIILQTRDKEISNYLETLNLVERYRKTEIFDLVEERAEIIYDTLIQAELNGEEINEETLKEYMLYKRKISKTEILSFAVNGAFSNLDLYNLYKKKI